MESHLVSNSAQVIVALIPIVGIACCAVIMFFYLLWTHHETKLKIRSGIYKEREFNLKAFSLLSGILLFGVGAVLTFLLALIDGLSYALLGGLIPLALGLCLLIFYKANPDFKQK